jgi:hypothetical protein
MIDKVYYDNKRNHNKARLQFMYSIYFIMGILMMNDELETFMVESGNSRGQRDEG